MRTAPQGYPAPPRSTPAAPPTGLTAVLPIIYVLLRTGFLGLSVASTTSEAHAMLDAVPHEMREFFRGFFFAGTVDDTVRYLQDLVGAGCQYLIFFTADLFAGSRKMTDQLLDEILPQVRFSGFARGSLRAGIGGVDRLPILIGDLAADRRTRSATSEWAGRRCGQRRVIVRTFRAK
jgi:hypothetical protein